MKAEVSAIGVVRSPRKDLSYDFWGAVEAELVLGDAFGPEAFAGLGATKQPAWSTELMQDNFKDWAPCRPTSFALWR